MPDIRAVGDHQWLVDGAADIHHLEQVLEIEGLVDDDEEYSTLGGYLLERFGHLPEANDSCDLEWGPYRFVFTVLKIEQRRIALVRIEREQLVDTPLAAEEAAQPENGSAESYGLGVTRGQYPAGLLCS